MTKSGLYWVILLIVTVSAGGWLYHEYEITRPCARPVHYAIGAIDQRFGITKQMVNEEADFASSIWNTAAGKSVLVYDPEAKMKINLIYDEREANAKLGAEITRQEAVADAARAALEARRREFLGAQDAFNKKVKAINARGGATQEEAAELDREKAALQQMADAINTGAKQFNTNIAVLNDLVREYNQLAGHPFEQGEYVRDSAGERINIFEFMNSTQLERVLAHEFGHSIGLDHNDDPDAIMYAKNESGNLTPTEADLSALKTLCNLK